MSRFSSWTNFRFTIGLRPSFCGVVLAILLSPATNPLHAFDTFAKVIPGLVDGLEDNVALQQAKTDSDGSTFVAGNILGSAQFSPTLSLPAPTLDRGRQTNDVFVGKLDPQGGWVWVQRVLIPVTDAVQPGLYTWFVPRRQVEVKDVAVTADAILVAGYFDSQEGRQVGFLVKLDKTGTRQWIRYVATISASRAANVNAVVAAPDGSVYFGGFCEPALAFIYRQSGNSHAVDNLATLGPAAGKTAYVAKLNSAGTFQWRLLGGASGTTSEETIALAIDGNNDVHALMNLGNGASVTNANNVLYRTVSSSFYVTPVAGKVSPGGAWMAFNDFDSGTDLAALPLTRNDVEREVRGTDLALIGGKAFVSGTATATGRKNLSGPLVTYRLGFLTRLGGDDYVSDNAVAYFINGRADSSLITHPTRIRGGGNRVYVTGPMPTTLQVYGENSPTSSSVGDLDLELLSLSDSDFVGAFDLSLRPLWLKTTSRATDVPRPNLFTGRLLAFALAQQRVLWGGSFRSGGSNLLLGQAPNELSLATSSADRVESWGWLTGITSEGDFLRQARLVVESAYEPIIINGEAQSTTRFEESYFQGTPITVRVADQVANDGGTRRKVTGFTLDNEVGTTAGNSLSLDLILDTTITFAWETQHRLLITSDHATAGLPATASPGSPTPLIGTNWLAEGTQVQATIDGVVYPIDQQAFGVRYKLKSYEVTLPAPTTTAISTPVERVAVQEFAMTRPATIAYSWSKQYSVTAQHSESSLRNLLVSRVLDGSGAEVSGSVVTSNGGERWFDAGSSIEFGALRSDEDIALKGWRYANPVSPGYFADGDFTIDTTATSDLQLDGELDLFRIGSADNNEYWVKRVANLTQPVTVFWNYGETVYVIHTGIGQTVSFSSAAPPMPATVGRWKELAVIQGPPGSNPDNMLIWDEATQTALPIRPGIVLAKWNTTQSGVEVVTQIFSGFPGEPWQDDPSQAYSGPNFYYHIANTPAVILDPSATDNRAFRGLLYSTGDGVAAGAQFSATQRGRSVLLFSTAPGIATGAVGEALEVRVVHTTLWNNDTIGLLNISQRATIGVKLSSAFDTAGKGTGYVMHRLANYNARIYDRDRVSGPIIPVNSTFDYPGTPRIPTEQDLVVVWYEKHDNIEWPARPVYYYGFDWPVAPSADATPLETDLKRIVIASRLGSEGLDAAGNRQLEFDPDRYEQVSVYHQPDRALPGFNPNEEHARIYPSLHASLSGRSVPAAYALRNDLNLSRELIAARGAPLNGTDYTSDPYVLVQYFDKQAATPEEAWKMAVYQVQRTAHVVDDYAAELPGSTGASYIFQYEMGAGELVVAPYPLNLVIGLSPCLNDSLATPNGSYFQDISANQRTWFVDHKGAAWAVSGDSAFEGRYYYRLQPDFWYPFDQDIGSSVKKVGDCIPFLPEFVVDHPRAELRRYGVFDPAEIVRATPSAVNYRTEWPDEVPVLKVGETLTYAGGENKADNSDAPGLPGIIGFAAGEIVFDSMNPSMNTSGSPSHRDHFMARIIAPLEERRISYATTNLPVHLRSPASSDITVDGDTWYFNQLPPSLQRRVFFKPLAKVSAADAPGVLVLRGLVNDRKLGDSDLTAAPPPVYLLEPNILNSRELQVLERVGGADPTWHDKVRALFDLSRNPASVDGSSGDWLVGVEPLPGQTSQVKPLRALGPGLALVTNPELLNPESSLTSGYVTIAENNHESLGEAPVTLHIIKVDATQLYRGAIKTMLPANVFDENITLRHTADFGGNVDQLTYEWWHREEDGAVSAGDVPPGGENGSPTWSLFADSEGGVGQSELELRGSPALLLADNLFFVRYHHRDASSESSSAWAGAANSSIRDLNNDGRPDYRAQLAMGWVKRVLDGVNPYEARIREFGRNDSPATTASLIAQLGAPFVGPVALNSSVDVIENLGLIELYETVLKRARDLSVDAENPSVTSGINAAILLASSRLADFYTALGREAWDDALDPTLGFSLDATIGFGNDTLDHGSLNSSRFCFENQLPTLLDEELALLRGTDESLGRPIFNRLFWNFTKGEGEVAYALNYQITDVTQDGFLDENDAMKLYPMGHGDAWGHYLSAMRKRYDLLNTPLFLWEARSEYYNLLDIVLSVDYFDERNFARTAAARARVGAEIVQLTFRAKYQESPDSKLTGYTDVDTNRGWGVTEWARRTGQAALFDWITANALLPAGEENAAESGIHKIDRSTVPEVSEIATHLAGIQSTLDLATSGMNPLGLDPNVLPFDLDPTHIDVGSTAQIGRQAVQGLSHFEQIFERAFESMRNTHTALKYANDQKARNRQVAQSAELRRQEAIKLDHDFRNRLIEIFGTPYEGEIGAGKAYPAGYEGPDYNLFMYVDINAITADTVPRPNDVTYYDQYVSFHELSADIPEEAREDLEAHFLDEISLESNTAVELLGDDRIRLRLPATAGSYTFVAPESWGQRAAPGRLQTMVSEILQVQAELSLAVGDYDFLIKQLRDRVALLSMRAQVDEEILQVRDDWYKATIGLNVTITALEGLAATFGTTAELLELTGDALVEAFPRSVGTSPDVTSAARAAVKFNMTGGYLSSVITAVTLSQSAEAIERSKEIVELHNELVIDRLDRSVELRGMLYDVEELLVNEGVTRLKMFAVREQLRGLLDEYRSTLQEGIRLIEERRHVNAQIAAETQSNRYHDVLFRSARHESIERYRALYDITERYCYLAAKAFDYETNFDPRDRASAQPLLGEIARTRLLGQIADTLPVAGPGLAGLMAKLWDNFRAVEGRLGFNNFQIDTTEFSYRAEKSQVTTGPAWRAVLQEARRADLWEVPEFRRFCRPFAARGEPQPGIVLTFPTQVIAGKNFFGNDLGGGHSAYDPTVFATKIRAVGIRFDGYPIETLARTPYVYLIPAGLDYMTIPDSPTLETRAWNVVDQAIPVPHATSPQDLARVGWTATLDSLTGTWGEIRRFSSFRAGVDAATEMPLNATHFIGRSIWNDNWVLIIPGQTLHADPETGIAEFIENVTDIRFNFETYGYSGN